MHPIVTRARSIAIGLALLLCGLLSPAVAALSITAPTADIVAPNLPADVTLAWSGNATVYTVVLNGTGTVLDTQTAQTTLTQTLPQGNYTLTVSAENQTVQRSFRVSQSAPTIGISVEKSAYDVGDIVKLSATSSREVSATLDLKRAGTLVETYSILVNGNLDLYYIPDAAGAYIAELRAEGALAQTSWTAAQPQPLAVDFTHTAPQEDAKTTFTATATGGSAPYTYEWTFSDDTSSTGKESVHYFSSQGAHSATLIVTDSEGIRKNITKSFTVLPAEYALEVLVRSQNAVVLQGFTVGLEDLEGDDDEEQITASSGMAVFPKVHGSYRLTVHRLSTTYVNTTINVTKDDNLLYTINYTAPTPPTPNTTAVPTSAETAAAANQTAPAPAPPEPDQEALRIASIEDAREQHLSRISERKFNLKLVPAKDRVLTHLKLYESFDAATREVQAAADEESMQRALERLPTDVTIADEKSRISYPDAEEQRELLDAYLDAKGVTDEGLRKRYHANLERYARNVSVRTESLKATIAYADREEKLTLVSRQITAPPDSYSIEVLPEEFTGSGKLTTDGGHTAIADGVLQFRTASYAYSVAGHLSVPPIPVVLPEVLTEKGVLSGLLTLSLGESDPTRSVLYLIVIGMFIGGLVAGKKVGEKRTRQQVFASFSQLAGEALEQINGGNAAAVTPIVEDLKALYAELPADQQRELQEIMHHISQHNAREELLARIASAQQTARERPEDINAVSRAYEQALGFYESMPEELRRELEPQLSALDSYLEGILHT